MTDRFQGKYRSQSARHPTWDYGSNAAYFVTICTRDRICWFGKIINQQMQFSHTGQIANECWQNITNHFPFVKLGPHVVMPNHVHGIIVIDKPDDNVGTQNIASLPHRNEFGPQSKNLASIIRGFKVGVTLQARMIDQGFAWQSRYHDHIIRDHQSYQRIASYIIDNPSNWSDDDLHST